MDCAIDCGPTTTGPLVRTSVMAEHVLYGVTMLVIVLGAARAIWDGISEACRGEGTVDEQMDRVRLELSGALSLGLTFFVGAEIIKTFRVPHWKQLLKVVVLILIRQLLTWSLDADTEKLQRRLRESKERREAS
jgi:uncharacterized membrane protein